MTSNGLITSNLRVPFTTAREAEIAYNTLRVDKEPKRSSITREMRTEDNCLVVHWEAKESRVVRVSVNSFMDHLGLVIQTIDKFGPPKT